MKATTKSATKKSLNLKKLGVVLAVPALILGGVGYWVMSDSEEEVSFQPLGQKNSLNAPDSGLRRTSLPGKSTSLPTSEEQQLSLPTSQNSDQEDAEVVSSQSLSPQSQQSAQIVDSTQTQQTTRIPSTVELLSTDNLEILVEDPFATSAVAAVGEQLAAQQQILEKRTAFAESYAKFLDTKVKVLELQKTLAENAVASEDEEGSEKSTSEKFLEDRTDSKSSTTSADEKVLDRFKVPEVVQNTGGSEVYEDIDEPEPIDVLGIISSSNTGSILILKDGRRLPLKTGTRLDENWKIQKVTINEEQANITFETNDHSKVSTQTVVF